MTEKIDTQGMSGEAVEGCKDNVYPKDADGNPIYPPANFKVWPIFDDKERAELKEIMLEALREYHGDPTLDMRRGKAPTWTLDDFQE
tara:strand:+ start:1293 stop:1553 length:261 start_codon:yes stop_codon:yes gene_type:complete